MSGREAFGPNLRRIRVQHGISLDDIARRTKVSADLWAGLERNDFSRWPTGIFARAYIREYAHAVGVDPEHAVDEFCRYFSHGDRRAERIVRGQAALVGHELQWNDDLPKPDRRAPRVEPPAHQAQADSAPVWYSPRVRAAIALADASIVSAVAGGLGALASVGFWSAFGVIALVYHLCGLAVLGASPAVAMVNWYLEAHRPAVASTGNKFGLRLLRGSERVKVS